MSKPILEVVQGIPLPGHYDDLKGIDLWGSGDILVDDASKPREMKPKNFGDNLSQKITKISGGFKIFKEQPIFAPQTKPMEYEQFVEEFGEIVDKETYQFIAETYTNYITTRGIIDGVDAILNPAPLIYTYESASDKDPFSTQWYPIILEHVKKPSFKSRIHKITADFINKNHEALAIRYPSTNITIPKNVIDDILTLCGMGKNTPKAVSELITNLNVKTDFKSITQSPHQIVFTGILMAASEIKSKEIVNDMITLMAFTMYPLIFRKYFKVVDPNKNAMEEAVTTASLKFYIAKTDDLLAWVRKLTEVPYDFYKERFTSGNKTDLLYIHFLNRLRNTMNQQFKSLYSIYKKAYNNKSLGKLNDDEFITLSSNTDKIQIYTMSVYDKIQDRGFRSKDCLSASKYTKVSNESLMVYIKEIYKDVKKYDLNTFVLQLLTVYFNIGNNENFLGFCVKTYPKMVRGKDNIHKAMSKYLSELSDQMKEIDPDFTDRYLNGIYIYFAIQINISLNNITNKLSELSISQLSQKK